MLLHAENNDFPQQDRHIASKMSSELHNRWGQLYTVETFYLKSLDDLEGFLVSLEICTNDFGDALGTIEKIAKDILETVLIDRVCTMYFKTTRGDHVYVSVQENKRVTVLKCNVSSYNGPTAE